MVKKKNAVALADPVIVVDELVDQGTFGIYNTDDIRISKTNRKRFNEQAMRELAANIKEIGVAQPILIRPVTPTDAEPQAYEIVAGERRYRASIIAGVPTIPAMCRVLSDLQAAKIQILENLQRENPHPLEEAEGYENLMLTHGYSADQLVEELKKSRSYIYGRLKLCSLARDLRDDFLDNKFSASTALLLARIPLPALQVKAAKEITLSQYNGEAMSYRVAANHIQNRYMLNLDDAPFKINDAKLLTMAGSCVKCPKRTGNQPDIFTDINPNICTDPDCFNEKRAADITQKIDLANKQGIPVHEEEEGKKISKFAYHVENNMALKGSRLEWFNRIDDRYSYCTVLALLKDTFPEPIAYIRTETNTLNPIYNALDIQLALEKAGYCYSSQEALDRANTTVTTSTGTTLATVQNDAYVEKCKREDDLKLKAEKETAFRVILYKRLRQRGFEALSLDSMRELVKLMLGTFALPDDLMSDVYPFGNEGSDDVVFEYIEQASMQEVQNILMDLVLGEALTVSWRNFPIAVCVEDNADFATLLSIAKTEGIDPDQLRADLDKPAEPEVDATPFKRPLISLKKKPAPEPKTSTDEVTA